MTSKMLILSHMKNKSSLVRHHLSNNNLVSALCIIKTFRHGFSKEEMRTIQIAYESLTGNSRFYESLGVDIQKEINKASHIAKSKYLIY